MPIAIFTDIDGTLINSDRRVTPETQKALQTCVKNGAILTLCSSRCAAGLVPILKEYDLSACMIALGGALIIDEQGQILHDQGMPLQRAAQLIRFVEEKGYDLTWSLYTANRWFVRNVNDPRTLHEAQVLHATPEQATPDMLAPDTRINKILCTCDPSITNEVEQALIVEFPELTFAQSSVKLIEITANGVDKGAAVRIFCEKKGIELDDTIGFGDNYNDLTMLSTVRRSVLMQNAPEALHGKFFMMTDDNDHDGIAKALKKMQII